MANNPQFDMQGISFVVSSPGTQAHPLPFKLKLPDGKRIEVQRSLNQHFTVFEVIAELRVLALMLETAVSASEPRLDYPAAVMHDDPALRHPPRA
jgi:hypothetical protein